MPLKGLDAAKRRTERIVGQITGEMAERTLTEILIIGSGYASLMTPVDTSTLINSQYREVTQKANGLHGRVGYTAAYAAAVNAAKGTLKGTNTPRAKPGLGVYWAPGGEPDFLRKGFEDPEAKAAIDSAVKRGMAL